MTKLWFKNKKYGWGWTPYTKEGWLITLLFILAVVTIAMRYSETNKIMFFSSLIVLIAIFIFIAYKKGEKPRWSWG